MSHEEQLVRLFEDPSVSDDLRADLSAARGFELPFDVGAGLARFQAHLDVPPSGVSHAPPAATAGGATAPTAAMQLTGGKVLAVLALGAGLGWGALQFAGGAGSPRVESPAASVLPRAAAPQPASDNGPAKAAALGSENDVLPALIEPQVTNRAKEPAVLVQESQVAASKRSAGAPLALAPEPPQAPAEAAPLVPVAPAAPADAPADANVAADPQDQLRREVAQLAEIRRTIKSNPAAALAIAERGHREFRGGALYQEREALALQALSQLGRTAAVEARGTAFLAKFPQSSFAPEVRQMLGR